MYVCIKWKEYMEEDCSDAADYGVLCLLAVWAVSVKLSTATLVLLACWPAAKLISAKRWKTIGLLLAGGFVIILPFLVRNVIISGYLIYPFEKIDIFNVDWKIPASAVVADSQTIKAWGKGLNSGGSYYDPAEVWIPIWYSNLTGKFKLIVWLDLLGLVAAMAYTIGCIRKGWDGRQVNLLLVSVAGLLAWFLTAPLLRYGFTYMFLLPILMMGMILDKISLKRISYAGTIVVLAVCYVYFVRGVGNISLVWPEDYKYEDVVETQYEGITFYAPVSQLIGYHYFPLAPSPKIELRTGKLEGGFRVKDE